MITYRVRLDVPAELVLFVSRLLTRHHRALGTRKGTRCLGCYRQALFILAWYRDKPDIPRLAAGFGLSQATSCRYVAEGTAVIPGQAPGLKEAPEPAVADGTLAASTPPCHASKTQPSTAEMLANPRRVLLSAKYRASHHGWPTPEEINVPRLAGEDLVFALSRPGPPAPDEGRK